VAFAIFPARKIGVTEYMKEPIRPRLEYFPWVDSPLPFPQNFFRNAT
jgi:hypothetical protein